MKRVRMGTRWIGNDEPCFIIAEAGSNHDGNLRRALQLIDVAASAGADAVKFQLFRASKLYPKHSGRSDYLRESKPIYNIMANLEMPYDWIPDLADHCRKSDIVFLLSIFDEKSADQVAPYVEGFKISSYELTHIPLVRHVANKGKPVIISTGAANLNEVAETVQEFRNTGNDDLLLMQCTAAYPAPIESLNVRAIPAMKSEFDVPVGLSDHSHDALLAPLMAVAVGANLLEKHFTLSKRLHGPDHKFALEPTELTNMVRKVREAEKALGNGKKQVHPVETELRSFARRSIFALCNIDVGNQLTEENIAILRCGKLSPGLPPKDYPRILGRRASRRIAAESAIQEADVA